MKDISYYITNPNIGKALFLILPLYFRYAQAKKNGYIDTKKQKA